VTSREIRIGAASGHTSHWKLSFIWRHPWRIEVRMDRFGYRRVEPLSRFGEAAPPPRLPLSHRYLSFQMKLTPMVIGWT
jgi:hypothetical protein